MQKNHRSIYFDHCFSKDTKHSFFKKLGKYGFKLSERVIEHPGKAFCRFLTISGKNSINSYLEFVWTKEKDIHKKPGISFGYNKNLKLYYKKILKKKIKAEYLHKNYDWINDSKSNLPGWNFITFTKPPIRNYFPWFTEYEPSKKKSLRNTKISHPNTVSSIYGIEISVNQKGLDFYEKLLGQKITNEVRLLNGIILFFIKARSNKFNKVVLRCRNMKKMKSFVPEKFLTTYDDQEAIEIKNPDKHGWDIVIF